MESNVLPVHSIKAHGRCGGTSPLILNPGTRLRCRLFPVKELRYPVTTVACSQIRSGNGKGKGKSHPTTGHVGLDGEQRYSSILSLTSALDGVGGQSHAPAALPPGKTRYPLCRRLGGPQGRSGQVGKISPPTGFRSRSGPDDMEKIFCFSPGFEPRIVKPLTESFHRLSLLGFKKLKQSVCVIIFVQSFVNGAEIPNIFCGQTILLILWADYTSHFVFN